MVEGYKYNAFISYSQAEDATLAPALQTALQRIGMPWHRLSKPRINIFRDATSLGKTPGKLTESIKEGLRNSHKLILLCSPRSKESYWVNQEVEYFKELCKEKKVDIAEKILIVVTEGDIKWDLKTKDWDTEKTNILPTSLYKSFKDVPLWVDLKDVKKDKNLNTKSPIFKNSIVRIAAFLLNKEPAEIDSIELRTKTKLSQFYIGVVALLLFLLGVSFFLFVGEREARTIADQQTQIAKQAAIKERAAADKEREARTIADQQTQIAKQAAVNEKAAADKEREARTIADQQTQIATQAAIKEKAAADKEREARTIADQQTQIATQAAVNERIAHKKTESLNNVLTAENLALTTIVSSNTKEKIGKAIEAHKLYYENYNQDSSLHLAKRPTIYYALYDAYLASLKKNVPSGRDTVLFEIEKIGNSGNALSIHDTIDNHLTYHLQYIPDIDLSIKSLDNSTVYIGSDKKNKMASVTCADYLGSNSVVVTGHDDGSLLQWLYKPSTKSTQLISLFTKLPTKVNWISHVEDSIMLAATYNTLYATSFNGKPSVLLTFDADNLPMAFDYSPQDSLLFIGFQNGDILFYKLTKQQQHASVAINKLPSIKYERDDEFPLMRASKVYPPISIIKYDATLNTVAFSTTNGRLILYHIDPRGEELHHYQIVGIKYQEPIKDILINKEGIIHVALKNKIVKWPVSKDTLNKGLVEALSRVNLSVK